MSFEQGEDRKVLLETTLQRRILSMRMAPGSPLDEAALCSEFGLSRPPVRELMRQMAGRGFIAREVNRSATVAALSADHFRRFVDAAPLIYISTTQLAAMNATPEGMDELHAISKRYVRATARHSVEECVLLEHEFHSCIGRIAHNPYLSPSLSRLLIDHARIQKIIYQAQAHSLAVRDMNDIADLHGRVVTAIELHEAEAAVQAARQLNELLRQRIHDHLARQHH